MLIDAVPDIARAIGESGDIYAKLALLTSAFQALHLIIKSNRTGNKFNVPSRFTVPGGYSKVGEVKEKELVSRYLTKEQGENWIASIHKDDSNNYFGDLPFSDVEIPDSVGLSQEEAIESGKKLGLFTVNKSNL